MFRKFLAVLVVAVAANAMAAKSQAQDFPGLGVGAMWQANMNFDNQFYPWAWQRSQQVAVQTRGQQLPFNAMTISAANNANMRAFEGSNANWNGNSNAQINAVEGYDIGAVRGQAMYRNSYGQGQLLPYGPNAYQMTPQGYIYPGANPYYNGGNMYPDND